ncbi:hypothetical protein TSH7_01265 [Azospirillum sp. TSH7]|uniref:hypothetical protein n=1 Tax=unclassified Azospirillum TaxID=2630922 RepID=UPI000D6085F3|nr:MULTISPECIES: hypothetical protein [unclassified Azospirillum]PWC69103.1 hypothetical protein TSH7_01265 [Azospirillum sp. TSH7]PWC71405.1 hypothetical protein TSH20_03810 [Azospirillum sp. TSH20]
MSAYDRFAASLRRAGRQMSLKRRVGTTNAFTECTVYGKARFYQPTELIGLVKQGDRRIRIAQSDIAAASWPGPPKVGDLLDGGAVQGAEHLYDGETLVGFVVWVRG